MQYLNVRGALVALCLCAAATAQAVPTLIGDTIDFRRAYPDVNTQYGPAIPSTTVAAGTSDVVYWGGPGLAIDPEADSISFYIECCTAFIGSSTSFDGFIVSGLDTDIDSVSVLSNTSNFVISLTHDLRSLTVNIGTGNTLYSGGTIVVAVKLVDESVSGVPEPATAGLAGLGLAAVLGLWRRATAARARP